MIIIIRALSPKRKKRKAKKKKKKGPNTENKKGRCYCMNTFEFDGKKYKMASIHQKEWGKTLISELKLKGDERILDLGCGGEQG